MIEPTWSRFTFNGRTFVRRSGSRGACEFCGINGGTCEDFRACSVREDDEKRSAVEEYFRHHPSTGLLFVRVACRNAQGNCEAVRYLLITEWRGLSVAAACSRCGYPSPAVLVGTAAEVADPGIYQAPPLHAV